MAFLHCWVRRQETRQETRCPSPSTQTRPAPYRNTETVTRGSGHRGRLQRTAGSGAHTPWWRKAPTPCRVVFWAFPRLFCTVYHRTYGPHHSWIGLFRAAKWANSPCECRQPPRLGGRAVPLECSVGNAPARPRALTVVACAWPVLPLEVRRQTRWLASRRRQRGSARPRVRPRRPQEIGRAAAVGNGGRLTHLLPRAARCGSPRRVLES
jgi:hypothetical protein